MISKYINILTPIILIIAICVSFYPVTIAIPYLSNEVHERVFHGLNISVKQIDCEIIIKYESNDGFIAGNPINFTANATFFTEQPIEQFAIVFKGAEKYFDPQSNTQNVNPFKKNVIYPTYDGKPYIITYSGSKNITFNIGGTFDIIVQWTIEKNDTLQEFKEEDAIQISSHEELHKIRSNNIMTGISYLGIWIALFIPIFSGLIRFFINGKKSK